MNIDLVTRSVNCLDLKTLNVDNVEMLQRMVPNDTEVSILCSIYAY